MESLWRGEEALQFPIFRQINSIKTNHGTHTSPQPGAHKGEPHHPTRDTALGGWLTGKAAPASALLIYTSVDEPEWDQWGCISMISLQVRFLLFQRKVGRDRLIDGISLLTSQSHPSPDSFICSEMGWKKRGGEMVKALMQNGGNQSYHDL